MRAMVAILLLLSVLDSSSLARKKDPGARAESDARAAYANEFEKAIELEGIYLTPRTVGIGPYPGERLPNVDTYGHTMCGYNAAGRFGGLCLHGNRTVLSVWGFSDVVGMMRFIEQTLIPRAQEINNLGFEYVELRSSETSANFSEGVADIQISRLLSVALSSNPDPCSRLPEGANGCKNGKTVVPPETSKPAPIDTAPPAPATAEYASCKSKNIRKQEEMVNGRLTTTYYCDKARKGKSQPDVSDIAPMYLPPQ